MTKYLIDPILQELVSQFDSGRITRRHIQCFIEFPERVLPEGEPDAETGITEALVSLLPKDEETYHSLILDADGQPLYVQRKDWKERVCWGKRTYSEYETIRELQFVNGQPLFIGRRNGQETVCSGKQAYLKFDRISCLSWLDDKPCYSALIDGVWHAVWGKTILAAMPDIKMQIGRDDIEPFVFHEGLVVYIARADTNTGSAGQPDNKIYLVRLASKQGLVKTSGPLFSEIHQLDIVDDKLLICGTLASDQKTIVGLWGNKEIPQLRKVWGFHDHDGKPVYATEETTFHSRYIHWGDQKISTRSMFNPPLIADQKPLYLSYHDQPHYHFVHWGESKKEHPRIDHLSFADGAPIYVFSDAAWGQGAGKWSLAYKDLQSDKYDDIAAPRIEKDAVTMIARNGRRVLKVTVPRKPAR